MSAIPVCVASVLLRIVASMYKPFSGKAEAGKVSPRRLAAAVPLTFSAL